MLDYINDPPNGRSANSCNLNGSSGSWRGTHPSMGNLPYNNIFYGSNNGINHFNTSL